MGRRLHWIGNVSLAFGLLAAASAGHAQAPRPWVDPPPEAGAPAPSSSPAPASSVTKPAASQPSMAPADINAAARAEEADKGQAQQRAEEVSSSVQQEKPALKPPPRKAVSERKERRQQTRSAGRSERTIRAVQSRPRVDTASRPSRAERVREGIDAGLEVMTLRTIEFPDGRRIQILTRPRPGAISELMEAPE